MTISPVLYDYPSEMLVMAIIIGIMLALCGVFVYRATENIALLTITLIAAMLCLVSGVFFLAHSGAVNDEKTLQKISSEFDVLLPKLTTVSLGSTTDAEFKLSTDESQVITVDLVDEKTLEVYEDARILWDGSKISVMVQNESTDYVPLR